MYVPANYFPGNSERRKTGFVCKQQKKVVQNKQMQKKSRILERAINRSFKLERLQLITADYSNTRRTILNGR